MTRFTETVVLGEIYTSVSLVHDGPESSPPGYLRGFVDDYLRWSFDCCEPVVVGHIVETLGTSRFSFARAFREEAGVTPLAYVRSRQLERAQTLLEATDLTIDRIAMLSGCGSTRSLYRLFAGEPMSPAAWRSSRR